MTERLRLFRNQHRSRRSLESRLTPSWRAVLASARSLWVRGLWKPLPRRKPRTLDHICSLTSSFRALRTSCLTSFVTVSSESCGGNPHTGALAGAQPVATLATTRCTEKGNAIATRITATKRAIFQSVDEPHTISERS